MTVYNSSYKELYPFICQFNWYFKDIAIINVIITISIMIIAIIIGVFSLTIILIRACFVWSQVTMTKINIKCTICICTYTMLIKVVVAAIC